jgi:hypothetical protein
MSDTLTTVLLYAGPPLACVLFLYACALVNAAWRLWRSEDERAWWRFVRQARRERRDQAWDQTRETWRTDLWHPGDGPIIVGLVGLAVAVIVLCR